MKKTTQEKILLAFDTVPECLHMTLHQVKQYRIEVQNSQQLSKEKRAQILVELDYIIEHFSMLVSKPTRPILKKVFDVDCEALRNIIGRK